MGRPSKEREFQQLLEKSVRDILEGEEATIAERIKAIDVGKELLQLDVGAADKGKDFFGGNK